MISKNIFIKTFGCQMNEYDSNRIYDSVSKIGFTKTNDQSNAECYILNTCHIRDKAKEKVYHEIGRVKKLYRGKKKPIMIVAGCVAQAENQEMLNRETYIDIVIGPQSYHKINNLLEKYTRDKKEEETEFDTVAKFNYFDDIKNKDNKVSAYLTIQEGCDKFCHFCVVPYTRGPEYSRPFNQIINEAEQLIKNGAKEIILLGQNVNAYHGQDLNNKECNLGKLIYILAKIKGLKRIRYMTAHPKDMHNDLYKAHKNVEKLMPFLHLPIQSGSNKILKAMNRNYSVEEYLKIINKVKEFRKDIVFSSDFIVGYPGETKEDFQKTLDLIDKVKYVQSFSFIYSPRPGTTAYNLKDNLKESEKKRRLSVLQNKLRFYQENFYKNFVKKSLNVLFSNSINEKNYQSLGYSQYMQLVRINNKKDMQGKIEDIKIKKSFYKSLEAVSLN